MMAILRTWFGTTDDIDQATDIKPVVRGGMLVLFVGIAGFVSWSALAPLAGAVIAPGVVKVDTNRKFVQHQEGGIVKAILVRDGDVVEAGQALIELNDVAVNATLDLVRTQLDAEWARNARLGAERGFSKSVQYPDELTSRDGDTRVKALMDRENSLFKVRREALESQMELLSAQIKETEREITARVAQDQSDASAIQLQRDEFTANEPLVAQGFISKTRLLGLQRAVTEYESRRGTNQADTAQARQRVAELKLRIVTLRNEYMQQAENQLKDSTARLFDLQERLRPTLDASERQRIVAPVSGEVVDLRVTTPGEVIGPRDRLMDIVPTNQPLIIESNVRPEDIIYVHIDGEADVRLTAFKQRITPIVMGRVTYVSADILTDPSNGARYYLARVRVDDDSLARAGHLSLQAGMPAEVHFKTEERTLVTYLLDPALGYVMRGLREP